MNVIRIREKRKKEEHKERKIRMSRDEKGKELELKIEDEVWMVAIG